MENTSIERAIEQAQQEQERHFNLLHNYAAATQTLKEAEAAQQPGETSTEAPGL